LIARYWAAVGIDVHPQPESLSLIQANVHSNLHDGVAWQGGSTYYADVLLNPNNYVPNNESAFWAVSWANWYNQVPGFENQAPGNSVDTALAAYNGVSMAQTANVQIRLMKGVLGLARDNFWTIGIASGSQQYGIMRRNFHNVPANMPAAWIYPDPAPANPEQFFIGS
jgi:peptide/nickel transport system substrate-binding protein